MDRKALEESLDEWTREGLVSAEQAEAIRAREARAEAAGGAAGAVKVPVIGEVLGYVGGVIALGAVIALVAQYWDQLGSFGQIGLSWLVALSCLAAGWFISRNEIPAARRLGRFLLFVGTIAFGYAVGIVMYIYGPHAVPRGVSVPAGLPAPKPEPDPGWYVTVAGAASAVLASVLWWFHRSVLQNIAIGMAVAVTIWGIAQFFPGNDPSPLGWPYMAFGLLWAGLAFALVLTPANATWSVSCLALLGGAQILSMSFSTTHSLTRWLGLGIGLALAIGMIVASIPLRRPVLLGFGAGGVVVFMPQLLDEMFGQVIGVPVILLVAGVLLVGMSAFVVLMLPRIRAGRSAKPAAG